MFLSNVLITLQTEVERITLMKSQWRWATIFSRFFLHPSFFSNPLRFLKQSTLKILTILEEENMCHCKWSCHWSFPLVFLAVEGLTLTLTRPIGLPPNAPVAQKIADQRWLIAIFHFCGCRTLNITFLTSQCLFVNLVLYPRTFPVKKNSSEKVFSLFC